MFLGLWNGPPCSNNIKRRDGIAVPGGGGIEEGELLPYFLDIPLATR